MLFLQAPRKNALLFLPDYPLLIVQKLFTLLYMGYVHSQDTEEHVQIIQLGLKVFDIKNIALDHLSEEEMRAGKLLRLVDLDHPSVQQVSSNSDTIYF